MDKWERGRSYRNKGGAAAISPSFSSSLLDAIDRSIDEGGDSARSVPTTTNHNKAHHVTPPYAAYLYDAHRVAGNYQTSLQPKQRRGGDRECGRRSSGCSGSETSDSSSAGGFSSSEAESVVAKKPPLASARVTDRSARVSDRERDPPAAVKAEAAARKAKLLLLQQQHQHLPQQKLRGQHHEDGAGTIKGRIRASRIYGELKKASSPVSPGRRLAAFLNTLFTNANTRSAKSKSTCTSPRESAQHQQSPRPLPVNPPRLVIPPRPDPAARDAAGCIHDDSFCSSASSYSRSCLSNTPSTHGGAAKRSVRFCPLDTHACSRRFFLEKNPPAAAPPMRPVEVDGDVEFYDDGTSSCSSSDLFELDNLVGVGTYADELPVYETTHLRTNRAIAQGLIV